MNSSGIMPQFRGKPDSWRHAKNTGLDSTLCQSSTWMEAWVSQGWLWIQDSVLHTCGFNPQHWHEMLQWPHGCQMPTITELPPPQIALATSFSHNIRDKEQGGSWVPLHRRNPQLGLTFAMQWSESIIWWKMFTEKQRILSFVLYKALLSNHEFTYIPLL